MVFSQLSYFFSVVLFVIFTGHTSFATKSRLMIGGLAGIKVEGRGWSSKGVVPAVELALERVNKHSDILKDYHLGIEWKDSKCASGFGIKGMVEHITQSPPKIAFLGPGCSIAAEPVAETLPFWNLTQISFSLTSPALSNKERYPNLYRVNPSETIHDPALVALTNLFKWRHLFIIKHELGLFNSMTESLRGLLMANKKLVDVIGYLNNTTSVIESLKKKNARIIILLMYETQAREIFCSVYKNKFHISHVVWILRGWYSKNWWKVNDTQCMLEEIERVMTNVIYVDHINYGTDPYVEALGLNKSRFTEKCKKFFAQKYNGTISEVQKYAPYGYDAVVMLARALNATEESLRKRNQSLREFTYARSDITEIIKDKISKTDHIIGLTGDITLDKQGDRITNVWLQQLQNFQVVNIAIYNTENNSITIWNTSRNFIWKDGHVPTDRRPRTEILLCVSRSTLWWTSCASVGGVFAALYFLWFNVKKSSQRFFKMSTPPLNNIMIFGAIIAYIYVPVHGIKHCEMEVSVVNSSLCKVDVFLISIAFSLVFGAIFMKTWRIYKIFTNVKLSKQLKFLTNKHLMALVVLLVLLDLIYLIMWNAIHPLQDSIKEVLTEKNHAVNKVYFAHQCTSQHYQEWVAGMMSYKGLLMIFGMFLTWETRNVTFPGLNESKYIGICVYNIFIISAVVLTVGWFALPTNVDTGFSVIATGIIFCTTSTLGLMFMPKIRPEKKLGATSNHPTMSLDKSVIGTTPNTVSGQCPTCKNSHP